MKTRPQTLESTTTCVPTGYGKLYVTITELNSKPFEVFCSLGKSGSSIMAKAELTGRMTSLALRNGIDVSEIVNQLIDIDGGKHEPWQIAGMEGFVLIKSIPDAVARVLQRRYPTIEGGENGL
jgi:ribonucleoside-diphosphate reductase alpha chain